MIQLKTLEKLGAAVCFAAGVAAYLFLTSVEARADWVPYAKNSRQAQEIPGSPPLASLTNR